MSKIIDFYEFTEMIYKMMENIPPEERAPESRIDGWIRTAHKNIDQGRFDISVVKLAIKHMEDFDDESHKMSVGAFIALLEWYDLNMTLSAEMPEYLPMEGIILDG